MKKALIIFLLSFVVPVFAGEFENAYNSGSDVLVYFYSPHCISCKKFDSLYNEISSDYKDIKFVKVNIDTKDGLALMQKYHGLTIPYLILTGSKNGKTVSVPLNCFVSDMCFQRVLKKFNN